ncbi:MAG: hypothetical protein B7C54_09770 [Acidimicrobiales bacterium mtb01]|nr:hypothetical protein [Actinomycetota bacterium]TEX45372.1 MAG: hypothetical protein B7C54_09770 [Acidimicrobiales bacterium mtb01]
MNTIDEMDMEIEATLRRAAGHLARRGSEYLEHPVMEQPVMKVDGARGRRLLVGTAAAATLCATALVGSFIGGTSSGKVDVAKAAWSAVPARPTAEQVNKVKLDCGITAEILAKSETAVQLETLGRSIPPISPNSIPDYMLEPSLVDVRGTTTTAVYFTWTTAKMCVQFGDGSIDAPEVAMTRSNESAWQEPIALDLFSDISATMILGFLPPSISGSDPNSTGESDKIIESQWEAYVDAPGVERTKASVNGAMERFVAWVPTAGNFKITFVNTKTGEERVVGATTGSLGFSVAPNSTVAEPPQD